MPVVRRAAEQTSATKARAMVRSCFFAAGLFVTLWGISLLFIDKLVLNTPADGERENFISAMVSTVTPEKQKMIDPPDWIAFSMMSIGAVTMLYAVALPKKG
jgi:hypothetical protein